MICRYSIDNEPFGFQLDGEFYSGNDEVLYWDFSRFVENCTWAKDGYKNLTIFSESEFLELKENVKNLVCQIFKSNKIEFDEFFELEKYHNVVLDDQSHQAVIAQTRELTFEDLKLNMSKIVDVISRAVNTTLSQLNPLLSSEIVIVRINRPGSMDINPFHRDGYLEIWKNTLNIWIPICGCSKESSLPIIPGSHYWNEKDVFRTKARGAKINGRIYNVPGIIASSHGLHAVRPNPGYGDALIFTPFLIHGGAINTQQDITRMSLELRLNFTSI